MIRLILALSVLGLSSSAFAMLPPYWDRVSQLTAVAQSTEVANKFEDEIDSVSFFDNLTYLVSSKTCYMKVTLKAQVSSDVGPTTYAVEKIGAKTCQ